jgi:PAS domain S-box-containing protein
VAARYGSAVVVVVVATIVQFALVLWAGVSQSYLAFYPATFVATLLGGFGPAALATALSVADHYAVIEPSGVLGSHRNRDPADLTAYLIAASAGLIIMKILRSRDAAGKPLVPLPEQKESTYQLVANQAPVMVWISNADKRCTYASPKLLEYAGRTLAQELGDGWTRDIHPDDLPAYSTTVEEAFRERHPFKVKYRMRRADGEYRWITDDGTPIFGRSGTLNGFIGSRVDITSETLANQALSSANWRLIGTMEAERSRIARELHDDITQRLALLAIGLGQLRVDPVSSRKVFMSRVEELQAHAVEISQDVQALSHELHSSKLDTLGLVTGIASFRREFSQAQKVDVVFVHSNVPRDLPRDLSLCLFRVMQEAMTNVVKHAGPTQIRVDLHGSRGRLRLTVADSGRGFNPAKASDGLGLISMRERVHAVGGTFEIMRRSPHGTMVITDVPIPPTVSAESA